MINTKINIPFQVIRWEEVERIEYTGQTGISTWQTVQFEGLRVRLVQYSNEYVSDHWCQKGHLVHCLEGELIMELQSGEVIKLAKGDSYIVSDDLSSHKSCTRDGVTLFIIDGDFLKCNLIQ